MRKFSNLCEEYTDIVYIHFMQEINEKFGAYNGQIEFVNAIVDFIMSEISDMGNNKSEVSFSINGDDLIKEGFENIFFDTIEIVYNETVKTGYISRNNFNEQTKRLKYVFIGNKPK